MSAEYETFTWDGRSLRAARDFLKADFGVAWDEEGSLIMYLPDGEGGYYQVHRGDSILRHGDKLLVNLTGYRIGTVELGG